MQKWLILIGVLLLLLGLLWPYLGQLGLGRLPGDIVIERNDFRFYFPIVTCLGEPCPFGPLLAAQSIVRRRLVRRT
jgi:Protein of unknown function (DUF2905)